jgi:DNA-binding beta-propeller fold protein YncE
MNEIGSTSAFVAAGSGGLNSPKDLVIGPDGNLYVASAGSNSVIRYNGSTGQLIGTFIPTGSGGLGDPFGLVFGPDGNLYVGSRGTTAGTNSVYRYNGTTGAFIDSFVSAGSGGLNDPIGLTFGPDGNLYVSSHGSSSVVRYQGPSAPSPGSPLPSSGQTGATFVATGSGGLLNPDELAFGPDGNLYVADGNSSVLKYDATTGGFLSVFVPHREGGLDNTRGIAFDQDGRLYVADTDNNRIHRYDRQGNYLDDPVAGTQTVLGPVGIAFDAQGRLLIGARDTNSVVSYDSGVTATLSAPSPTAVCVSYATADGSALAGTHFTGQTGTVTFAPGQTTRQILLATRDENAVEGNTTFALLLSNPSVGATIGNGIATVTRVDDDASRQFAISDSTTIEGDHTAHSRGDFVDDYPRSRLSSLTFGPDGKLYVGRTVPESPGSGWIQRYNGATGAFIDTLVDQSTGLKGQGDIAFRAGYMYVASKGSNEVRRYDPNTGAFVDAFVTAGSGGISAPVGLSFGPDANNDGVPELYVAGESSNSVVRYDGATGQPLGTIVTAGSGGLSTPEGICFDPSQTYLYVSSSGTNQVLKYNARTGVYVGVAAASGLSSPQDVKFGPDGLVYVVSAGNNRIERFNTGGTYVDDYVPAGSGGMVSPYRMAFGPDGDLYVSTGNPFTTTASSNKILRFGTESEAVFTVTVSTPSSLPVNVDFITADGSAVAGTNYAATGGTVIIPASATTKSICVLTLDDGTVDPSLTFTVKLANATGGVMTRSQGIGTISDSDVAAKFYVVNDATSTIGGTNTVYKYQPTGTAQASFGLSVGDLDPRGVAANAAGTTEWVVDANKNVYVYRPGGILLGSWSAGGLGSSAQLTGIATNGTDLWLVDSSADKVYKYSGAASRLSGSQSAAGSFGLVNGHNGNTNPQDIVTDGTFFWVVDGTSLKVFKYTLSGSSLGSWSIDRANAHPTGITINPNNVSDVWVVDSGTLKVYQYATAAGRTSGSQNASATFALAAGDTNPQGIADPPAVSIADATATEGGNTIRFIDDFVSAGSGGLQSPRHIAFGPDGKLYVASKDSNEVLRYDGATGTFLDAAIPSSAGLVGPFAVGFGPDGSLYVAAFGSANVFRYSLGTGTAAEFVSSGSGGLTFPKGLTFGPDGNLYVSSADNGISNSSEEVLRYDGHTGACLGVFVANGSGGLDNPSGLVFGPDGNLYVANTRGDSVNRYNGVTGAFINTFVAPGSGGLDAPVGMMFRDAKLFVVGQFTNAVLVFDATTGAFLYSISGGGLNLPDGIAFDPAGNMYVGSSMSNQVLRYGPVSGAAFAVTLSAASTTPVTVQYTTADGTAVAGSDYAAVSGTLTFAPGQTSRTVLVPTLDDHISEPTESFFVNLSNPIGATIARGQGTGTIIDNNDPLQVSSAKVNGGAIQRSRVTDITVAFTGLATLPANPADAFRLARLNPDGSTADVTLAVDPSASTATQTIVRLSFGGPLTEFGSLTDGEYRLTVLSAQVFGNGQPLDGDANGSPGGDFTMDLFRLFGDINGDKAVNGLDLTAFRNAFGSVSTDANYLAAFDWNGDGAINGTDLTQFRNRFGVILP